MANEGGAVMVTSTSAAPFCCRIFACRSPPVKNLGPGSRSPYPWGETAGKLHGGIHRQFLQSFPPKARATAAHKMECPRGDGKESAQ